MNLAIFEPWAKSDFPSLKLIDVKTKINPLEEKQNFYFKLENERIGMVLSMDRLELVLLFANLCELLENQQFEGTHDNSSYRA